MQKVHNRVQAGVATRALNELAVTIAIPGDHRPSRLPSFPNLERTAVLGLNATRTIRVNSATTARALLLRSPAAPLWVTDSPLVSVDVSYSITPSGGSYRIANIGDVYVPPPGTPNTKIIGGGETNWFDRVPTGRIGGRTYYYVPEAVQFQPQITIGADVGGATFKLLYDVWSPADNYSIESTVTITAGQITGTGAGTTVAGNWITLSSVQITAAGAAATLLSSGSITNVGIRVAYSSSATYLMPAFYPTELQNSTLPYSNTRITAAAALFTNVSQVMTKEGTVQCARVPVGPSDPFDNFLLSSSFTAVHPKEKYFGPLEMGLYAYTMPDKASEHFTDSYDDGIICGAGQPRAFSIDLGNLGYASMIAFSDIGGDSTTLAVTLDYHLEFRTSSLLFPVGFSTVRLEDYHMSQMALARLGSFFENPVHLSAIASMVSGAVRTLLPIVAPYAMQAARAVGSHLLSAAANRVTMTQKQMVVPTKPKPKPKKQARAGRKKR